MSKLKVYGGNLGGRWRAIMACKSIAEFMRASRIERDYLCETGNAEEIAKATSEPGKLFVRSYLASGIPGVFDKNPWTERKRADQ